MSQERTTYPPLVAHGPSNHGAKVIVVSFSFMFVTILFAVLRTWSLRMQKRELGWDDITFFVALLLIIPETIFTERAVYEGLGQHINDVATSKLAQYYKYIYATQILGIIIQAFAKLSVLLMVERITAKQSIKKFNWLLTGATGIWVLFSIFSTAFQCGTHRPWVFTSATCAVEGKLYYGIVVGDILIDGFLACYFIPTVWGLQMARASRILVSALFGSRLVVCAVSIAYLALLPRYLLSNDKTWDNANVQIMYQVVVNLSTIASGVPSVSRFFSELQTGKHAMVLNDREIEMVTGKSRTGSSTNGLSNTSAKFGRRQRKTHDQNHQSPIQSRKSVFDDAQDWGLRPDRTTSYTTHVVGGFDDGAQRDATWKRVRGGQEISDDNSTSSLTKDAIYQQRDFEMHVEYDHRDGESR